MQETKGQNEGLQIEGIPGLRGGVYLDEALHLERSRRDLDLEDDLS